MGRDYLDEDVFRERGMRVAYSDIDHPTYVQVQGEFVLNLALIDLLFNCGPAALDVIAQGTALSREQRVT